MSGTGSATDVNFNYEPAQDGIADNATARREQAIANFREVTNTEGVTPEEIVLAAADLKEALGTVSAMMDVVKTISDEAKRIVERAFQA